MEVLEGGGFLFENLGVQYRAGEFVLCSSSNSPPYIGVCLCNAAVVRELKALSSCVDPRPTVMCHRAG